MSIQLSSHFPPVDAHTFYWDVMTLSWVPGTQPGGGGGGTVDQGTGGLSPWLVTASSWPLPTNAAQETGGNLATIAAKDFATSAKQDTGNASLSSIDTKLTSPLTVQATNLDIRDLVFASDAVNVTGSTVTANAGTNLNTSLLALESGGNLATLAAKDFATQTTLALLAGYALALNTAQEASASGVVGPMVQARVDVNPPSYGDAVIAPLSMTPDGRMRTSTASEEAESAWDGFHPSAFSAWTTNPKGFALDNQITIDTAWSS